MNETKGEETIFIEALSLPPEERAAYLAQATHGAPELRQRVESLLGSYGTGDFLEEAAAPQLRPTPRTIVPITEKAGDTIGRYKLLQQIGEGGCGIVYMAEQAEPVRRRVALKIIKLGMDTKSVIARFEAERQALAMMDHPNIAKVFDAGATETGRPYFVMELVRGLKITDYCDEAKLSTRARLDVFIQVCQAIQHAHQKGIIHRDIKPSNILVSVNDGVVAPKVIDFGIAKATSGQQLTDKTLFTAFEQFIGTPAYMSPEQAVLTNVDVDTRSDIYALGVLLYELLTGKTPFDAKALLAIGLDEMRRTIREQEPPRPSTRLSTLPGQELSTAAQRRGLDPPKLVSELRGDLDWIVMKCIEKDRARRYETANGLASDVQRHLKNEPVVACPPSKLYRLQKTVRRNKLVFAAGAAVGAALVVGIVVSMWHAARAQRAEQTAKSAEQKAKAEKDSAEAVLTFVRDKILAAGRPEGIGGGVGKDVTLRQAVDAAESNIARAFTNRPLVEASIRKTMGESYLYLGEPMLAIPQLERALEIRRERLGVENEHTVETMTKLRQAYKSVAKPFEFVPFYEEALQRTKAKRGPNHPDTLSRMNDLAMAYSEAGKMDQAVPLYEETLKLYQTVHGREHRSTASVAYNLGVAYGDVKNFERAFPLLEETVKRAQAKLGPEHRDTLERMAALATVYKEGKKPVKAIALYEETLKLMRSKLGPDDTLTLGVMNDLGLAYQQNQKPKEAALLLEEVLELNAAKFGREHAKTVTVMNNLGLAYDDLGQSDKAIAILEAALTAKNGKRVPEAPSTLSMRNLALAYQRAGKFEQALPLFEKTLNEHKAKRGSDHKDTLYAMNELGVAYQQAGKPEQAATLFEEALRLNQAKRGPEHKATLEVMNNLGTTYCDLSKFEQAIALHEAVLKLNTSNQIPTTLGMRSLALAYKQAGKFDQALPLFEKIVETQKAERGPEHAETLSAMNDLGLAYGQAGKSKQAEPLLEAALEVLKAKHRPDSHRTLLLVMNNLANAYGDLGKLDQAIALHQQTLELKRTKWGPAHASTVFSMVNLANICSMLALDLLRCDRFAEAEPVAREALAIREQQSPDDWRTFNSQSMLGGSLVGQKRYADAEPLLRSGYDGMMQREEKIPLLGRPRLKETLQRLVQLCEATNRPEEAASWKAKLADFENKEEFRRAASVHKARNQTALPKTNEPPK